MATESPELVRISHDLIRIGARARLKELDSERAILTELLNGDGAPKVVPESAADAAPRAPRAAAPKKKGGRPPMSAAARAATSKRMKKFWAKRRREAAAANA